MKRLLLTALTIVAVVAVRHPFAQGAAQAEKLLAAADHRATVDGDLKGAIDQYKQVVAAAGSNRALAAQALLRMAQAYQKLGDAQSRTVYQQLVREFPEQKDTVTIARRALEPAQAASELTYRRIWTLPCGCDVFGNISPDGRYIPFMDYDSAFMLHDVVTGLDRRLSGDADATGEVFASLTGAFSFSRDGKQIAYAWENNTLRKNQVRVISLAGTGLPSSRTLIDNDDIVTALPHDWSPDGKWIAVALQRADHTAQIALVSPVDGSLRVLKSVDWRGPTHLAFSPDGRYLAFDLQGDVFAVATDLSREVSVVNHPAEDAFAAWSPDGSRILFTSDRTGSIGLWSVAFQDGVVKGPPELLKRDMGNSMAIAGMANNGTLYSVVYDGKTIGNMSPDILQASFDFSTGRLLNTPELIATTFVGTNRQPEWSPDGRYLSYLSRDFTVAIRTLATGEVHELSLTKWFAYTNRVSWASDSHSLIVHGTDVKGRPGIFRLSPETGIVDILLLSPSGNRNDVSPVSESPDGRFLYYRLRDGSRSAPSALIKRDLVSGRDTELLKRSNLTVPGTSLSPDGRYLVATLNDPATKPTLLLVSVDGGEPRELLGERAGQVVMWSPDSQSVIVRRGTELWRVPLTGEPSKLSDAVDPSWTAVRVHPDGKRIAIQTSKPSKYAEVWALEHFLPQAAAKR